MISLVMIVSAVGCMNNNTNLLPINPDSFNLEINTDESSNKPSSDSNTESENGEVSENDGTSRENDESSSNGNENKPSNETARWTGFY